MNTRGSARHGLTHVRRFLVPHKVLQATEEALQDAGRQGLEMFVLWSGVVEESERADGGTIFMVRTRHVPRQRSYRGADGLCVRVEGDALHRLNVWLYQAGELLGVQVHTHPRDAYHSTTDDTYPIVTLLGGLSIVVPHFCRAGLLAPGVVGYRLQPEGWHEIRPRNALRQLIQVLDVEGADARDVLVRGNQERGRGEPGS